LAEQTAKLKSEVTHYLWAVCIGW